ncbi:carotenoid oxygenase [Mycolicibacterium setense]|uniref:Dioxygenase n=1 Tax=Mycolicibacterium setense TaxID=431269 RepID=A0ABR4YR54_9MYCO|nr:carotenoid oxygenase family protein [Mycolicibacterium setense]KHO22556.1 carotenoid oxygenase [Mycolicibacterium setense]
MTTEAVQQESEHPFLSGNFAPVHDEVTVTDLTVTGTIPDYLDGRYLRTGPNPLRAPDPRHHHWFLGDGMAHGIRLRDGAATWYRNRWVRSSSVARELGEKWAGGAHAGGFDFPANTNIIGHAGKTLVLTEAGARPYELTDELDTVGPSDFCGTLFGGFTAHPKHDPKTGELHAVSYNPLRGNLVSYSVTGVDGRVRRTVDIALRAQTMMHDFTLTEKYVVLYDLPVLLDLAGMVKSAPARAAARLLTGFAARHAAPDFVLRAAMRGSERAPLPTTAMPYRWAPEHGARIGLLPREGAAADIRWFDIPPCYVFHALNGYDQTGPDGEQVVLDVVRHPAVFTTGDRLFTDSITLDRWTIDLRTGRVHEQRLDDSTQEFPRVDDRLTGLPHRYGYTVSLPSEPDAAPAAILRHDLRDGTTERVGFGPGREPGEFVFVPSGPDAGENDGVLMGFVYDRAENRSDLVMLDGQSLAPVATVHIPVRVPHGFHGNWVAAEDPSAR